MTAYHVVYLPRYDQIRILIDILQGNFYFVVLHFIKSDLESPMEECLLSQSIKKMCDNKMPWRETRMRWRMNSARSGKYWIFQRSVIKGIWINIRVYKLIKSIQDREGTHLDERLGYLTYVSKVTDYIVICCALAEGHHVCSSITDFVLSDLKTDICWLPLPGRKEITSLLVYYELKQHSILLFKGWKITDVRN